MSNLSFEQATPVTPAEANGSQTPPNGTQTQEAGKSAEQDVAKILQKRVDDSQDYIKQLKAQLAEKEVQLASAKKVEDVLARMETPPPPAATVTEDHNSLDPNAIKEQLYAQLKQDFAKEKETEKQQENFAYAAAEVAKVLGRDNLDQKIEAVAKEKGLTLEEAKLLAASAPKVFLGMFPEVKTKSSNAQTHSTLNSQSFNTNAPKAATFVPGNLKSVMAWAKDRANELAKQS